MRWNEELASSEAIKWRTKKEFKANNPRAYKAAWRYGWLDRVCAHMAPAFVKWNEESIQAEALKYKTRSEFRDAPTGAAGAADRLGVFNQVCAHMPCPKTWTEEAIRKEALRYSSKTEFKLQSGSCLQAARRLDIFEEVCSHMQRPAAYNLKWTPETIAKAAKKYNYPSDFKEAEPGAYFAAVNRLGILDQVCAHMEKKQIEWTDEKLFNVAKTYRTKVDLSKAYPGIFNVAKKRGLWETITAHTECGLALSSTKWTDEEIIAEAKKYKTISDFQICPAGRAARRRKLMGLCTEHMEKNYHHRTNEDLAAEALKYSSRSEFNYGSPNARATAQARGLMDEICKHMKRLPGDADSLYIWRAVGELFNGKKIYKLGVTSERLGMRRIREVAKAHGFRYELVVLAKVDENAFLIEQLILSLGDDPKYVDGDGKTEFRAMTDGELAESIDLIEEYQV